MRTVTIVATIVVAAALAIPAAQPARAGMIEDCVQDDDRELKISGCTAVIQAGIFTDNPRKLALTYLFRGLVYGDDRRAIQDFDEVIRLDPEGGYDFTHWAYINRGVRYRNLGEHRRAIQDFDQAIRLDSGDAPAYHERGTTYNELGEHRRAVEDWERAIQLHGAPVVKMWQNRLKGKGLYSGAIDGNYGPDTKRALLACARDPDCWAD